jgi:hypothetical protein
MDRNNQPAIVHNGVTKFGECDCLIGEKPPIQFEPCNKLERARAAVVAGVNKSSDNRKQAGDPELCDDGSLELPELACWLRTIITLRMNKVAR